MASLLAQPVGAVRNDLTQQLTDWTHAKSLGERPKKHSAQKQIALAPAHRYLQLRPDYHTTSRTTKITYPTTNQTPNSTIN